MWNPSGGDWYPRFGVSHRTVWWKKTHKKADCFCRITGVKLPLHIGTIEIGNAVYTWNPNDTCFDWSLGLLLKGGKTYKKQRTKRFHGSLSGSSIVTQPWNWPWNQKFSKLIFPTTPHPPKIHIDTRQWCFGKCNSFQVWVFWVSMNLWLNFMGGKCSSSPKV